MMSCKFATALNVTTVIIYTYVCVCVLTLFGRVRPFATLWTVARQALLSKGFSRKEYQSGLPGPPPGDLPNPGTEPESPVSPAMQADSLPNILYRIYSVYFSIFFIEYTKKKKTQPKFLLYMSFSNQDLIKVHML